MMERDFTPPFSVTCCGIPPRFRESGTNSRGSEGIAGPRGEALARIGQAGGVRVSAGVSARLGRSLAATIVDPCVKTPPPLHRENERRNRAG